MDEQIKGDEPILCLRCREVMFPAQVNEGGGYYKFVLQPLKRKWWGSGCSKMAAWVCQACGYVELHAVDIAAIYPKPEK